MDTDPAFVSSLNAGRGGDSCAPCALLRLDGESHFVAEACAYVGR